MSIDLPFFCESVVMSVSYFFVDELYVHKSPNSCESVVCM